MTVTVIVPTMNELEGLKWFMPQLKREWYDELLVVDGRSTDGTLEYCKQEGYPVLLQTGRGLPNALDEAFEHTRGDVLVVLSPDGNSLPELIPDLVTKMRDERCDMVIASRYLHEAVSHDDDRVTRFGNWMFTQMVNILFRGRYTDTLVIYRAYSRSAIERMRLAYQDRENRLRAKFLYMNGWEMGSAIRAAKLRLKVAEVAGDEPKRIGGARKLSILKNGLGTLLQILYEFVCMRDLKPPQRKP